MKKTLTVLLALMAVSIPVSLSQTTGNRITQVNTMLIVDASSYSGDQWYGSSKIVHIRNALAEAFHELNKSPSWGLNMGLRIFGDTSGRDRRNCVDYRLGAKLDWFEPSLISRVLEGVTPKGKNCLAYAIAGTRMDFPLSRPAPRNFMICIVSARDECTKDELVTMQFVVNESNVEAIHIIGVGLSEADQKYMNELFHSVPGSFVNSASPDALKAAVSDILTNINRKGQEHKPKKVDEPGSAPAESDNISG